MIIGTDREQVKSYFRKVEKNLKKLDGVVKYQNFNPVFPRRMPGVEWSQ